jgi:predicted amidophosphoribosyltransferase
LLGIDVRESLKLDRPISKRALGLSAETFERRYAEALSCAGMRPNPTRVIVVDELCTQGSTLAVATAKIRERYPDCQVVGATAAQMTIVEAIADGSGLLKKS